MAEWISLPEAARQTGIPERSLRRYVDRHAGFIPTRRHGRTVSIDPAALPILRRLRELYEAGKNAEQVEETLAEAFPHTLTVADPALTVLPAEALRELAATLSVLRREVAGQRAELAELRRLVDARLPGPGARERLFAWWRRRRGPDKT